MGLEAKVIFKAGHWLMLGNWKVCLQNYSQLTNLSMAIQKLYSSTLLCHKNVLVSMHYAFLIWSIHIVTDR